MKKKFLKLIVTSFLLICNCNGYSKILVAIGAHKITLDDIEIIDISSPNSTCKPLPSFPVATHFAGGGLGFQDKPIICGGHPGLSDCFTYSDGSWNRGNVLNDERAAFAITRSPFQDGGVSKLFVTGGYASDPPKPLASSEILTESGWQYSVLLPIPIYDHCMVAINSSSVIIIGGRQGDPPQISSKTYILNSETLQWSPGPSLSVARKFLSCALINKNPDGPEKSVIVVGGDDGAGEWDMVEILDVNALEWRQGPELPFGITSGAIIEESTGGVIFLGGYTDTTVWDTLFRLEHVGKNSAWKELPHKMRTARFSQVAFLIPDEVTDCN